MHSRGGQAAFGSRAPGSGHVASWTCHLELSLVLISVRRCSPPRVASDLHLGGSKKAVSALAGFSFSIHFFSFLTFISKQSLSFLFHLQFTGP